MQSASTAARRRGGVPAGLARGRGSGASRNGFFAGLRQPGRGSGKGGRRLFAGLAAACFCLSGCGGDDGAEQVKFRISVDTGPNHLRNHTVRRFIAAAEGAQRERGEGAPGRLRIELFESGQLSKDRDLPKALHWGSIDMGVPAQSKLARFLADTNLFTLPALYGLPEDIIFALHDGPIARELNRRFEEKLGVKVLGRNIPLGFTTIYTTGKAVARAGDLRGMKIRTPGGAGPLALFQLFAANPITLPFPDVPLALAQGSLDGMQSTHETVMSGQLWQVGLRHCYEGKANFLTYVPMVSKRVWRELAPELRALLSETWSEATADARAYAARRQGEAKRVLMENGIACRDTNLREIEENREALIDASTALVERLGMDENLYRQMLAEIERLQAERAERNQ